MADGWKSVAAVALGPLILVVGGVLAALHLRGEGELRGPSSYLVDRPAEAPPVAAASPDAADPWAPVVGSGGGGDAARAGASAGRTVLLRPEQAAASPAAVGAAEAAPPPNAVAAAVAPLPPSASPAALRDAMESARPAIRACVAEWTDAGEVLDGRLVVELVLGAQGVEEAAVVEVDNLPPLVGTCFASAVWDAEWPATAELTTVRYPFDLTPD